MKVFLWIYSVVGSLYFFMYMVGSEVIEKYAVGMLWWMMVAAPWMLAILVWRSIWHQVAAQPTTKE